MTNWIAIGALAAIPRRGARIVRLAELNIAVFRTSDDEIFAIEDRCPHKAGPLSQGIVHGRRVTCPLHNVVVELTTGEAVAPDSGAARRFPVRIDADQIFLGLEVPIRVEA